MKNYDELSPFSRSNELNAFSHWYPKVKNCGIPTPQSVVINTSEELLNNNNFYMENWEEDMATIKSWVDSEVLPKLDSCGLGHKPLFVKNSKFSGKFNANANCFAMRHNLAEHIANIMYEDLCFDVGGENEIVIRERINYHLESVPCIYNGLPLRPEFRVFYDFDSRQVIFTANYWDYDYVYSHLYDRTDRIVFDAMRAEQTETFEAYKDYVAEAVAKHMAGVQGLHGPWSIDIMFADYPDDVRKKYIEGYSHDGEFEDYIVSEEDDNAGDQGIRKPKMYLIDMAVAERSAYWEKRPLQGAEAENGEQ